MRSLYQEPWYEYGPKNLDTNSKLTLFLRVYKSTKQWQQSWNHHERKEVETYAMQDIYH